MTKPSQLNFHHNDEASRFEVLLDGKVAAFVDYSVDGDVIDLIHTETVPEFRGQGVAAKAVDHALAYIQAMEKQVRPSCPYVAHRLEQQPELKHLIKN